MVSTLKLTKIQIPNSDSDVLSFNSSTGVMTFHKDIKGEGTNTTNLQQGLAKCWINFEGDGTIATSDSFNVSGITDITTGDYSIAINNDMNNANYSTTGSGTHDEGSYTCYLAIDHDAPPTTSTVTVNVMNSGNSQRIDAELLCVTIHGDLA